MGIRSFGAEDAEEQFITFDVPFNLILGRNGCGKTTIIEALKYACTGAMPHGQGSNFVRDPKLDRKIEVLSILWHKLGSRTRDCLLPPMT